uniref:Alpha/beta hydrolase n=2 Tax=Natrinema halophilum TaxID=1699371 RepID=A0A7D5KTU4_9EURY
MPYYADRYRCLAPDQRLFGRSTDTSDGPGVDSYGADLTALLDHLEIAIVAVVGHSMEVARCFVRLSAPRPHRRTGSVRNPW